MSASRSRSRWRAKLGRMPENFDSVEVEATMDATSMLGVSRGQVGTADDQPIPIDTADDLPRAVTVRLTVHRRVRRRIDSLVMSAVSLNTYDDDESGSARGDR